MTSGILMTAAGFSLPRAQQRVYNQQQAGFNANGLINLYLLTDADPSAAIVDSMGNNNSALVLAAATSQTLLTGGGVNFKKWSYIAADAIDVRTPFTILGAYTVPPTASTTNNLSHMGFYDFPTYGVGVTGSEAAATSSGATRIPYLTAAVNGAAGPAQALQAPRPTYGSPDQVFLSHDGSGNFTLSAFERGALCNNLTVSLDLTAMTAGSGTPKYSLQPTLGLASYRVGDSTNKTDLSADLMAVWSRQLSPDERATAAANAWSIQQGRGRT